MCRILIPTAPHARIPLEPVERLLSAPNAVPVNVNIVIPAILWDVTVRRPPFAKMIQLAVQLRSPGAVEIILLQMAAPPLGRRVRQVFPEPA